jgi:hypothetical protein
MMDPATNRVLLVYKMLGQVLNNPQSFGLGDRAPKALIEVLSTMRESLREELAEENQLSAEDWLSDELSQDADRPKPVAGKCAAGTGRNRWGK